VLDALRCDDEAAWPVKRGQTRQHNRIGARRESQPSNLKLVEVGYVGPTNPAVIGQPFELPLAWPVIAQPQQRSGAAGGWLG